jgi:hypothetical protein
VDLAKLGEEIEAQDALHAWAGAGDTEFRLSESDEHPFKISRASAELLPPDSPLWDLDNVLRMPHTCGYVEDSEAPPRPLRG